MKSNEKKYNCIALVARNHGLSTIKNLNETKKFNLIAIFTHKFNPKSYDPTEKERDDFINFLNFAKNHSIPFFSINSKIENSVLETFCLENDYDFLISISWRYLISEKIFNKAKIGSINLHRGDLPKYAGVEPIKRALKNSEKYIVISCHHINKDFDRGEIISKVSHQIHYDETRSLLENVERLKHEITPYFPELTIKSLNSLLLKDKIEK